ncbi:MAG: polysaccharide pyruvyl transferase family protein [Bacilli bacterium]
MKIKIITIHNIPNFGSIFQCLALCEYLKNIGFLDIEVIDYNPTYFKTRKIKSLIGKLLNYVHYKRRSKKFDAFIKSNIPITAGKFSSIQELNTYDFNADLYIAGGDQLWNIYHDSGRDDVYKLVWTSGNKISYGTSMGQTKFDKSQLKDLAEKIADFKNVSVRESSSVKLLNSVGIKAVHCVDPIFLLDSEFYNKYLVPVTQPKYLLVYLVTPSRLLNECIVYLSRKYNLKTILCSGFSKKCVCDLFLKDLGPNEILSYIKNAEIILSSSFHATAFSLLFEKQFFTILPDEHTNERILDILSIRNLRHRIITNESSIESELSKEIDYEKIDDYSYFIESSKKYLDRALSSV